MAALITLAIVIVLTAGTAGAFLLISLAIRKEDRTGSLRSGAPSRSAQVARSLVGISGPPARLRRG